MESTTRTIGEGLRALVVEDEQDVAEYIETVLTDNGFQVEVARDGVEAMRRLENMHPDLVTLDITLPEQSGVKCYRQIKENADTAQIKVVMITGVQKEFKRFIHNRRQVPAPDGYVAKPFSAEDLIEAVQGALGA